MLDLIEFKSLSVQDALAEWRAASERPFHAGLGQWTEHAVRGYLAASEQIPVVPGLPHGESLEPVSRLWARQRGPQGPADPDWYEEMVADRRYAGHGVRELRVVRKGSVVDGPRDESEIAVAVGVLAGGSPVLSSRWEKKRLTLGRFEEPRLVRLVEIGCVDASYRILFEGTPEDAYARYDSDVEARIGTLIAGGSYRPGTNCGRCEAVATCPEVPSRPGLLGINGTNVPRRSWSMTTGRTYGKCPARAHLEDLFLPREGSAEDSEAVVRGKAVHAWIENRHRRMPSQPCEPDDTPGSEEAWQGEGWALTGLEARLGIQMIGDHALVCPLRDRPDDAELHPERPVVVYDPDADVVVIAKTDLLYRAADRWTLRETKTAKTLSKENLLEEYPQLALAVVLADAEVLPGSESCAVELERLTGTGPVVTNLEAAVPDVVAQARRVLMRYVSSWHADTRYPTKAGKACKDCPFTRWCPDAVERSGT
ncbi:PD-(D/E)XK nuclease family protein [Streptomyces acidiscabies]|uniref:PD-(D/E)XK nuclease family protein n=1 Tax=Streptomyces acidiscabies TaxID=42234 RepID=UPI0038F77EA8